MNVGELFVSLGVKGSDKAVGAVSEVKKGLKDVGSTSLEAKAAIVGVMYALERLFASSGKTGTSLTNFNALMGGGAQTLQRYQYAARQVGISNEAMQGTFESLAQTSTKILRGEARPSGLANVSMATGLSMKDLEESQSHPEVLLQHLQKYAQMEKNIGLRNSVLESFVGKDMAAGLVRNAFNPAALAKAPTYSDKELKALDQANIAWSNLSTKVEMAIGHFNALHGGQLVSEFTKITNSVIKMAESFMGFADSVKLFDKIDMIFKGWAAIFDGVSDVVKAITALTNPDEKKGAAAFQKTGTAQVIMGMGAGAPPRTDAYTEAEIAQRKAENAEPLRALFISMAKAVFGEMPAAIGDNAPRERAPTVGEAFGAAMSAKVHVSASDGKLGVHYAAPTPPATAGMGGTTQNISAPMTFNFQNDGSNAKTVADSTSKAVKNTYRTLPSLLQGK